MIYFFVGTTAELIKLFPIMVEMRDQNIDYEVISSGQNQIVSSTIFEYFGLKAPSVILSDTTHKKTAFGLLSWFFKSLFIGKASLKKRYKDLKGAIMLVHGDTVSTVLGALVGKQLGMKVCHIEAGLRSYNYLNPFPEEIDRVITSRLASVHFAPNEWASKNLDGKKGEVINTGENTLLDSLRLSKTINLDSKYKPKEAYFVLVVHRQENLFDSAFVESIFRRCIKESEKRHCVIVLHELTKIKLIELDLLDELNSNKNITLIPRLEYMEFMTVLSNCEFLVTDGGSNQEEAYYMGKPCLILRTHTERVEGLDENVLVSKKDESVIDAFFKDPNKYSREPKFDVSYPSKIVVSSLVSML
ncbi:UDP-N-acetylglucosamine 2-epimerase [Marinomonas epiphytica]